MLITKENINSIGDGRGYPIDDYIKPLVIEFNRLGLSTLSSCEGHTTHGLPYPWVDIDIRCMPRFIEVIENFFDDIQVEFLHEVVPGGYKMCLFRVTPLVKSSEGRLTFDSLLTHLLKIA